MDNPQESSSGRELMAAVVDLGPLSWVVDTLRDALQQVDAHLEQFSAEVAAASGSHVTTLDTTPLRLAAQGLHESVGVLDMVERPAAARMVSVMEAAVQRFVAQPELCTPEAVAQLRQAGTSVTDYLTSVLKGNPDLAPGLFPAYRAVAELAQQDRIHPADLWNHGWDWIELPLPATEVAAHPAGSLSAAFLQAILAAFRSDGREGVGTLADLGLQLQAQASDRQHRVFWQLFAAVMQAVASGGLEFDHYIKRLLSRVASQLNALQEVQGDGKVSGRLAQDLLYFAAAGAGQLDEPARVAPLAQAVVQAYRLADVPVAGYVRLRYGVLDKAQGERMQTLIAAFKELWSDTVAGDVRKAERLHEICEKVLQAMQALWPGQDALQAAIRKAVAAVKTTGQPPGEDVGMEMATTVLFLEASLDDYQPQDPAFADRATQLAQRLEQVLAGQPIAPLTDWMQALYMRMSDSDTMRQVVVESRAALTEIEQGLDQFFREPESRKQAEDAVPKLDKMAGSLAMLGYDDASHAVHAMRQQVQDLVAASQDAAQWQTPATRALTERLGDNLGTLSFLLETMGYQPEQARRDFYFDAQAGSLLSRGARKSGSPSIPFEPAAPADADGAQPVSEAAALAQLNQLATQADLADQQALAQQARAAAQDVQAAQGDVTRIAQVLDGLKPQPGKAASASKADDGIVDVLIEEDDLRDIFLEEAAEVIASGQQAVAALQNQPDDAAQLTNLRRAFHTLKGSGRMVGLASFGEAAWEIERVLNGWLAEGAPASTGLLALSADALKVLAEWRDAVAAGSQTQWHHQDFKRSMQAFRADKTHLSLQAAGTAAPEEPAVENASQAVAAAEALPETTLAAPPEAGHAEMPAAGKIVYRYATKELEANQAKAVPAEAEELDALFAPELEQAEEVDASFTLELGQAEEADALAAPALEDADQETESGAGSTIATGENDVSAEAQDGPETAIDIEALTDNSAGLEDGVISYPSIFGTEAEQVAMPADMGDLAETRALDAATAALFEKQSTAADIPVELPEDAAVDETANRLAAEAVLASILIDTGPQREVLADMVADLPADQVKQIGDLQIPIALFNAYLNEADSWSRQLANEIAEWRLEYTQRKPPESASHLAHSLAGSSATVGMAGVASLARGVEHAIDHLQERQASEVEASVLQEVTEQTRQELHQFAAGLMHPLDMHAMQALAAIISNQPQPVAAPEAPATASAPMQQEQTAPDAAAAAPAETQAEPPSVAPAVPVPAATPATPMPVASSAEKKAGTQDVIDPELFEIFRAEADELLPQTSAAMRQWTARPDNQGARAETLRLLHTLKGGARLAGAMQLGAMAHELETSIGELAAANYGTEQLEQLQEALDTMDAAYKSLRDADHTAQPAPATSVEEAPVAMPAAASDAVQPAAQAAASATTAAPAAEQAPAGQMVARPVSTTIVEQKAALQQQVRVRAHLLDRMLGQAGEVMTSRARLAGELGQLRGALGDMDSSLVRLRAQLRDMEVQAESQMQSRMALSRELSQNFDPLEFDRFTRVQELTRLMAESVNDVATVQRNLIRTVQSTEDDLQKQARQTKDLQDDLLRTRMVEFDSIAERLYRVVRQASRESDKQVKLDIVGANIEMDRSVIERIAPAFEHLLRNAVVHGVEDAGQRARVGKEPVGQIAIDLHQEGNDVVIKVRDDGAGLDVFRIRDKAAAQGLLAPGSNITDEQAAQLIFNSGLSTVDQVTSLAGRGVGMDVVRSEVNALGGRIEVSTRQHLGTEITLVLPLTTAVTQVVDLRMGEHRFGVSSHLIEVVRRTTAKEIQTAYNNHSFKIGDDELPFYWGGAMVQESRRSEALSAKRQVVVVVRSAAQRLVLHVDEVLGAHEVVVKNLGPQLARMPGLSGITVLPDGRLLYIYNPVALSFVYGEQIRAFSADLADPAVLGSEIRVVPKAPVEIKPLVLVVDDSITVRRVTERLLKREGYRVALAADGMAALRELGGEKPAVVLSDIEMPKMDGFDLLRNIRADDKLKDLPVVMITSRTADKHRQHATELGANGFLGKPYPEDDLLKLVKKFSRPAS